MKKLSSLLLLLAVLFPIFAMPTVVSAFEASIDEYAIIAYAIPPKDDSMTNPHYELLGFNWISTIHYYINPSNKYGFSTSAVVNTITTSANMWDKETAFQVFSCKGTTTRFAGKRDGYNVVAWGVYQAGAIAVTYIWTSHDTIIETDCRMNTYYTWSLTGEAGKMDVQNIMTHEFGHWCGLADLYADRDYWLTMYGYGDYGETYKRTLGLGDVKGLEAVYGR
jgi:hypothetical protein